MFITIPIIQEAVCGLKLKAATLLTLYLVLFLSFFGLVIVTSMRLENESIPKDDEIDIQYILNMVMSIMAFVVSPVALYGTYREKVNFLIPYLFILVGGLILSTINIIIEVIKCFGNSYDSFGILNVLFLVCIEAAVCYMFLIVYSYYTTMKEQREEIP